MSRKSRKNEAFDLPSFQMIRAASNGDIEAIRQVHYCVDETLRRRLETKLITKILAFEI